MNEIEVNDEASGRIWGLSTNSARMCAAFSLLIYYLKIYRFDSTQNFYEVQKKLPKEAILHNLSVLSTYDIKTYSLAGPFLPAITDSWITNLYEVSNAKNRANVKIRIYWLTAIITAKSPSSSWRFNAGRYIFEMVPSRKRAFLQPSLSLNSEAKS